MLRPVYDAQRRRPTASCRSRSSPDLAHDTDGTIAQAKELLRDRVDRPNVMIKIPATLEGIPAIEETIAAGINVNVTLIFSLDRHAKVIEAYLDGPRAAASRRAATSSTIASVASFFVSRVDTETDRRLPEGSPLRGKAAVANAKLAYAAVPAAASPAPRWDALAAKGARAAAAAVGVDVDEEPGVLPHALRRRADRARHREHARAGVDRRARSAARATCAPNTVTEGVDGRAPGDGRPRRRRRRLRRRDRHARARGRRLVRRVVHRRLRHHREAPRRGHRASRSRPRRSVEPRRGGGRRARRRRRAR